MLCMDNNRIDYGKTLFFTEIIALSFHHATESIKNSFCLAIENKNDNKIINILKKYNLY